MHLRLGLLHSNAPNRDFLLQTLQACQGARENAEGTGQEDECAIAVEQQGFVSSIC